MKVILIPLFQIIFIILDLYLKAVFLSVIVSWLVVFNIININQRLVFVVRNFLYRITEPAYQQIRRFIPIISGIDLSPLFLILAIYFVKSILLQVMTLI